VKAAVCTAYGPPEVFRLKDVEPPRLRRNGVCICLFATSVTASDCIVRA
jgi:NADPH:quinone reductase-like Zn-dependent oxidoreductase